MSRKGKVKKTFITKKRKIFEKDKHKDEFIINIIKKLDSLKYEAKQEQLGTIVSILQRAKEELVYWAVDWDFYESDRDKFINEHLY